MSKRRSLLKFEKKHAPVISIWQFAKRLLLSFLMTLGLVIGSLAVGMCGYHFLESLSWIDSFLNAAMILGGMGPVNDMKTDAGKIFAGCYALYSGLVVIVCAGIILAPLIHRILHRFHADVDEEKQ
jgi:hypothetical protein